MNSDPQLVKARCDWCGRSFEYPLRGRRRKYCSRSCRQRAYEKRNSTGFAGESAVPVEQIVSRREAVVDLTFQLRCAAEDVSTAVAEGSSQKEVQGLVDELVRLATQVERAVGE
ncbi:hypothetical protein [Corynebacterium ulceribovis]|uniref:hypothetical protein n=1 Tax=Corynebacterium ulceribovis TaxID=487732 RepID=UPI000A014913|nr:hypothetical protein [Corynebacterium ulceribovis]